MREEIVPTFLDPFLVSKYSWSARRNSVVKVESRLPLCDHGWLPLQLKIQRNFLAQLFKDVPLENESDSFDRALIFALQQENCLKEAIQAHTAQEIRQYYFCREIAFRLKDLVDKGRPRREKVFSMLVFRGRKEARFLLARDSLPTLARFFSASPTEGWTQIASLTLLLQMFLLSPPILKRIIKPARGREFKKQMFLDALPPAYIICNELVIHARKDEETREELSNLLVILQKHDKRAKPYLEKLQGDESWERCVAPCLVYWGFYGAWEKFDVAPLQTPEDLLRQYVYGEQCKHVVRTAARAYQLDPTNYEKVMARAKELYLDKRGAAAQAFDLI